MNITYKLLSHQKKFLKSSKAFTVMLCGRGSGKTFAASLLAAIKLIEGKRIILFAQTYKSLNENLMSEVVNRLNEMGISFDYNRAAQKITYKNGVIYGLSYENIEAVRGYTEISIAILDEIALAPSTLLPTLVFCMRGANIEPHIYGLTTPRASSWFNLYVKEQAESIDLIHATTLDNKFITEEQIKIMKSTCVDDNMLRQELYGEIVEDNSAGTMFSTSFLVSCDTAVPNNLNQGYAIGVDCSGLGTDSNVVLLRQGNEIKEIVEKKLATASELCSIIKGLTMKYGKDNLSHIAIDEAYGLDLKERLIESGIYCVDTVAFGGSPTERTYLNNRAEIYFNLLKDMKENGLKGLTEELIMELKATRYTLNSSNKLQLIPKSEIKINIGRSPDIADALALTYYKPIVPTINRVERKRNQAKYMM